MSQPPSDPPSGATVILYLFLFLALACTGALALFASMTEPEYRLRIYVSMVANIMLATGAVNVFVSMNLRRAGVSKWWIAMAWWWLPALNLYVAWRQSQRA